MSMPASSSTAVRRDTIACRFDRRSAPIAIVTDITAGSATLAEAATKDAIAIRMFI